MQFLHLVNAPCRLHACATLVGGSPALHRRDVLSPTFRTFSCALLLFFLTIFTSPLFAGSSKIGVVLSGGGSRGFAHAGVLKALELNGVPIHRIGGASMGSFIGCLYATGYSADEIHELLGTTDWDELFQDTPRRKLLFFPEKNESLGFLWEFSFENGSFRSSRGIKEGYKLRNFIALLTLPVAGTTFDRMPIPFRTVATDLVTGKEVILDGSELSLADSVRASMGFPLLFAPVETETQLLVDGGLVNNLPVQLVRNMGADVIIAVDVSSSMESKEELTEMAKVLDQVTTLHVDQTMEEQRLLADIVIHPNPGVVYTDFSDPATTFQSGLDAVSGHIAELQGTAKIAEPVSPHSTLSLKDQIPIASVSISGRATAKEKYLLKILDIPEGESFTVRDLQQRIERLYGVGYFDVVNLEAKDSSNGKILQLEPEHKKARTLRFGATYNDKEELLGLINIASHGFGRNAYRFAGDFRFGAIFDFQASYLQYALLNSGLFLRPKGFFEDSFDFVFPKQDSEQKMHRRETGFDLAAGYTFRNIGEVALAYRWKRVSYDSEGPAFDFLNFDGKISAVSVTGAIDTMDDISFPTSGFHVQGIYDHAGNFAGGAVEFDRFQARIDSHWTFADKHTFSAGSILGTSFDRDLPSSEQFILGGPGSFMGFARDELRGDSAALLQLGWRYRLTDYLLFTKRGIYLTAAWHGGDVWERENSFHLRHGAGVGIAAESPIGPVTFDFGIAEQGRTNFYFSIGYPL